VYELGRYRRGQDEGAALHVSTGDVVQEAADATGLAEVPLQDRTALLSDNGPGYLSHAFGQL
jgi:hypothetical protein